MSEVPERRTEDAARPADTAVELGLVLRRCRLEHGLSFRVLARRLGLSAHSGLADYEQGRRIPPADLVATYERVFHLAEGELEGLRIRAFAERATRRAGPPTVKDAPAPTIDAKEISQTPQPLQVRRARLSRRTVWLAGLAPVLGAAIAFGVYWLTQSPAASLTAAHAAAARTSATAVTTGAPPVAGAPIAGPSCPKTPSHIFSDYNAPNADGWHQISGGWAANGCGGRAEYSHHTGLAMTWAQTADWIFQMPGGGHCLIEVYIPDIAESEGLAQYDLYNSTDTTYDKRMTTFAIDQSAYRGRWAMAGPFSFAQATVDLEITDRGTDHAAIAISAASLNCG
jgi:transcriptional regulator with XRE-family HTH domain